MILKKWAAYGKTKPEPLRKTEFLLQTLEIGIFGSIPGLYTVFRFLVPAAGLPFGVLSLVCGVISTDCARYADILGLFRILGSMSIIIFWAVLGSPKLSARSGIQSGSRQQARA